MNKENMFRNIEPDKKVKQAKLPEQLNLGELVLIPVVHAGIPDLRRKQ